MGRPIGSRNPDFDATRDRLLRAALARLMEPGGSGASLRDLSGAAGVSVATMRHYFGDREGIVTAALARCHADGMRYLVEVAAGPIGPVEPSLRWLLGQVIEGFRRGPLSRLHTFALAEGLREAALGPAYLDEVLEPTLQATEARLARHVAAGEIVRCDLRHAALALLGPLLLALLHQGPLGGEACRPLDIAPFAETHLQMFLKAFGTGERPSKPPERSTTHRAAAPRSITPAKPKQSPRSITLKT